jgi:hypothetical protein
MVRYLEVYLCIHIYICMHLYNMYIVIINLMKSEGIMTYA